MISSWKYYASRLITGMLVLVIVVFILSTSFTYYEYERRRVDVRNEIRTELLLNSSVENKTYEERQEWRENKTRELRSRYGIEESFWELSVINTFNVFRGDLGRSRRLHTLERPVSFDVLDIILEVFPNTVLLYGVSAAVYLVLGLLWGLKSAQKSDEKGGKFLSIISMFSSSIPMWWLGMLFLLVFAFGLDWFPGSAIPFPRASGLEYYLGVLHRMVLPITTIVLTMFGARAFTTRNLINEVLTEDHIMAARAKGTPEKKVVYGHAFRTASPSLVSNAMRTFLLALPSLIITEAIFGWPGIGTLYYQAVVEVGDMPVILGLTFFNAVIYISVWLVSDIVSGFLDPRIKLGDNNQ